MSVIHGTEDNFRNLINDDLVLVDFSATWCGPCKMLTPVLEEITEDRADIKIVKVDVDECEVLAQTYGVMSVPTLVLFKNGSEIAQRSGFIPKEMLLEWVNENI